MPDIEFNCPHCKQSLAVEETGAGMAVPCPSCGQQVTVPQSSRLSIPARPNLKQPATEFLPEKCPSCGYAVPQGTHHCVKCGLNLNALEKFPTRPTASKSKQGCPSCGFAVEQGASFCSKCGTKIKNTTTSQSVSQTASRFNYAAMNAEGKEFNGVIEAENLEVAHAKIRSLGLFPTSINPVGKELGGEVGQPRRHSTSESSSELSDDEIVRIGDVLQRHGIRQRTRSPDKIARIGEMLQRGDKIGAIKIFREFTGVGLAEAKVAIEEAESELRTAPRSPASSSSNAAPGTNTCPQCGEQNRPGRVDCWKCGVSLKAGRRVQMPNKAPTSTRKDEAPAKTPSSIGSKIGYVIFFIALLAFIDGDFRHQLFGLFKRKPSNQAAQTTPSAPPPSPQPTASAPPVATTNPSTSEHRQQEASEAVKKGLMYGTGNGVPKDEAEAVRWFRKAAEAGNSEGMYNLGIAYANGLGVEMNMVEAVKWFRMGVDAGKKDGMYYLGVAYASGLGVEKNEAEAVNWYRKAIEVGDAGAMLSLGVMYWEGRGVKQDLAEGTRLFQKAAELGNPTAKENLAKAQEYAKQQQAQQQQPKWEDIMERGNRKNPPDRDAAEILLKAASDKWVKQQIDGGNLISGSYIQCDFEYPRNHESVDSKATFAYQFVFYTKSGHQRRNIGYVVWVHYFQKREWFMSDTLTTIDGMPTNW